MKNLDDGHKNKDKKPLPGPLQKLKDVDPGARDKLATRLITGLVICAVGGYAVFLLIPERPDPVPNDVIDDTLAEGPGETPGPLDSIFTGASGSQSAIDEIQEPNSETAAPTDSDGYSPTGGKELYAIGLDRKPKFAIRIPLEYGTYNSAGGTYLKPDGMDLSADSNEPLYFSWAMPEGYAKLMEHGGADFLDPYDDTGMAQNDIRAIDYYLSEDKAGNPMPVVIACRTLAYGPDAEWALDDIVEYYIIADCGESLPFTGRITGYALDSGLTQRYPTLNEFARAMIPAAQEPGFPEGWDMAYGMEARAQDPSYGDGPENAKDAENTESPENAENTESAENPENADNADSPEDAGDIQDIPETEDNSAQ